MYTFPIDDEDDFYEERSCLECNEKGEIIEKAGEFLNSIINQLYTREELNTIELESNLDELCYLLDVNIGKGDLTIERKNKVPTYLSSWAEFNKTTLKGELKK